MMRALSVGRVRAALVFTASRATTPSTTRLCRPGATRPVERRQLCVGPLRAPRLGDVGGNLVVLVVEGAGAGALGDPVGVGDVAGRAVVADLLQGGVRGVVDDLPARLGRDRRR